MNKNLTTEQIIELMSFHKCEDIFISKYIMDDFLDRYGVKNNINIEIIKNIKNEIYDKYNLIVMSYGLDDKKNKDIKFQEIVKLFASALENNNCKIKWYSHDFWSLFSFKEMGNTYKDWENGSINYFLSKEEKVAAVKFLKKYCNDDFIELNKYLKKMYTMHTDNLELLTYWLSLAVKKENKEILAKENYEDYKFINSFGYSDKETMILRKIEAISLFTKNTESHNLLNALKKEMTYSYVKRYPTIMEFVVNKIKSLGEDIKMPVYHIVVKEEKRVTYSFERSINVQAIVGNKIADYSTAMKVIDLLDKYLSLTFEKIGVNFERKNNNIWINELSTDLECVTFCAKTEYNFRDDDINNIMDKALDLGINYLLKYDKKEVNYYSSKDVYISDFIDFFNEYQKVKKDYIDLKERLGTSSKDVEPKKPVAKI